MEPVGCETVRDFASERLEADVTCFPAALKHTHTHTHTHTVHVNSSATFCSGGTASVQKKFCNPQDANSSLLTTLTLTHTLTHSHTTRTYSSCAHSWPFLFFLLHYVASHGCTHAASLTRRRIVLKSICVLFPAIVCEGSCVGSLSLASPNRCCLAASCVRVTHAVVVCVRPTNWRRTRTRAQNQLRG